MSKLASATTMTLAVLLFIGGTVVGLVLFLQPANTQGKDEEECDNQTVDKGDDLTPNLVTLNIYNSGEKAGQANRASINLQRKGFLAGKVSNAPDDVSAANVTVIAKDRDHPAAKLLSKQFKGKVKVKKVPKGLTSDDLSREGIAIVIGPKYNGVKKKAPRKVETDRQISVCVPLEHDDE